MGCTSHTRDPRGNLPHGSEPLDFGAESLETLPRGPDSSTHCEYSGWQGSSRPHVHVLRTSSTRPSVSRALSGAQTGALIPEGPRSTSHLIYSGTWTLTAATEQVLWERGDGGEDDYDALCHLLLRPGAGRTLRPEFDPEDFDTLGRVAVALDIMSEEQEGAIAGAAAGDGALPTYAEMRRAGFAAVAAAILDTHGGLRELSAALGRRGPWRRPLEARRRAREAEGASGLGTGAGTVAAVLQAVRERLHARARARLGWGAPASVVAQSRAVIVRRPIRRAGAGACCDFEPAASGPAGPGDRATVAPSSRPMHATSCFVRMGCEREG